MPEKYVEIKTFCGNQYCRQHSHCLRYKQYELNINIPEYECFINNLEYQLYKNK